MSTEAAPAPEVFVPSPGPTGDFPATNIPPNDDSTGKTSFREAMKIAGLDPDAGAPARIETAPKKEQKQEKAADDLPDHVLHGVTKKEDKAADADAPTEEDFKLLQERPAGQIKHDHFERVTKAANWKIKAGEQKTAELEAKLADYEAKLKSAPMDEEARGKLTEYEKKVADRDALLSRIAYEQTDEFQQKFTAREQRMVDGLKSELKGLGVDEDLVDTLLHTKGTKRYKALDELDVSESARVALTTKLVQYDDLQADKSEALKESGKNLQSWQAEQKTSAEKAEKNRLDQEGRVFKEVGDRMAKTHEYYTPIDGNTEWNAKIEKRKETALQYLHGEKSWEDLCEVVYEGIAAKDQHDETVVPLRKHVAKLEDRISKLTTASPGLTPAGDRPKTDKKLTPDQQAMDTFRQQMTAAANNGFQP